MSDNMVKYVKVPFQFKVGKKVRIEISNESKVKVN